MKNFLEHRMAGALVVVLVSAVLYLPGLGSVPFYTKGEPREGLEVWEIVHHGHWVLPLRNGVELPSKPPLFHWLGSFVSFAAGGVSELSIRLPSALLATATAVAVHLVAASRWGPFAGLFAALTLLSSFEWMRSATHARVDMTLTACMTAAFLALERAVRTDRPPQLALFGFYVAMGFATLSKGPVGLILPTLVGVIYLALRGQLMRLWTDARPIVGMLIAVTIPLAWYVGATIEGGESFFEKQILKENFGRFFEAEEANVGHVHSPLYLLAGFGLGFLPWSPFLVTLGLALVRERRRLEELGLLFPLVWFATVFLFFSISEGKRTVYVLPAYPAAAMLFGWWWARIVAGGEEAMPALFARVLQMASILMIGALVIAAGVLAAEGLGASPLVTLAPILSNRDQANIIGIRSIIDQRYALLLTTFALLAPLVAGLFMSVTRQIWGRVVPLLVVIVVLMTTVINTTFRQALAEKRTYAPFMEVVRDTVKPTDALSFGGGTFDYGAIYYSRRHIRQLAAKDGLGPASTDERAAYLLLWESSWNAYPDDVRATLEEIAWSTGNGPKGRERLVLVKRNQA